MKDLKMLVGCILLSLSAGLVGSIVTFPAIAGWYAGLVKPAFAPPNWLFGPAWTVLYVLMGTALWLVLRKGTKKRQVRFAALAFMIQLVLNAKWSILFFGFRNPLYGLIGIVFLWVAIAATMWQFKKIDARAFWLMVPYILWVSFAALLNYSVWMIN